MLADQTLRTGAVVVGIPVYDAPTAHSNSSGIQRGRDRSQAAAMAPPVPTTDGSANGATSWTSHCGPAVMSPSRNATSGVLVCQAPVLRAPEAPWAKRFSSTVTPVKRACARS